MDINISKFEEIQKAADIITEFCFCSKSVYELTKEKESMIAAALGMALFNTISRHRPIRHEAALNFVKDLNAMLDNLIIEIKKD